MNQRMNSLKPKPFFLRSTTTLSLHERFSQVLVDQLPQPRAVTLDPVVLQQHGCGGGCGGGGGGDAVQMVLLMKRPLHKPVQTRVSALRLTTPVKKRRSVWTRLGWRGAARRFRPGGFWGFRNKYKRRNRLSATCRGGGDLRRRLGKSRIMTKTSVQKPAQSESQLSAHLQRGGASTLRGRGWNRARSGPSRKQLDAELDQYMSQSKRHLDQQLEDYMSKTRSRLDQQLDEYMAMAGQSHETSWEGGGGDNNLTWYWGGGGGL